MSSTSDNPPRGRAVQDNVEAIYPLSPMQAGMLFHTLYAPDSGVYFEQLCFTIQGNLDLEAFHRAWRYLIERHPALRTLFVWENRDKPLQVVLKHVELPWEVIDRRDMPETRPEDGHPAWLESWLLADQERPFDLCQAPLMRVTLFRISTETYHVVWSFHHILLDGWSVSLLLKELLACYEAYRRDERPRPSSSRPYRDYIAWLQQRDLSKDKAFWTHVLRDLPPQGGGRLAHRRIDASLEPIPNGTELDPKAFPRLRRSRRPFGSGCSQSQKKTAREGAKASYFEQELRLSPTLTAALGALTRHHQLTLNTLMQGVWALLLSRYGGERDVVFGATVSGRPIELAGAESMVGLFINTLPVRVQVSPHQPLLSWLKGLQTQQVQARQFQYSPLVEMAKWSGLPQGQPLFESILVYENYPGSTALARRAAGIEIRDVRYLGRTNYPLTVGIIPGKELILKVGYAREHFDDVAVSRLFGHLQTLLEGIAANPKQRLDDLVLMTEAEKRQLLVEWNAAGSVEPGDQCIQRLFEAQAERAPNALALVYLPPARVSRQAAAPHAVGEVRELCYRELNRRANQVAHRLQKLGVAPETIVGVCMDRSPEFIIGLLAILKAGGAYMPLDPTLPRDRLAFMLQEATTRVVLSQTDLIERLPRNGTTVVALDGDADALARESDANPTSPVSGENLAYVIYTSGSTGRPKGVLVPHKSIASHCISAQQHYRLVPNDRVLALASFSFDASLEQILPPLATGATVMLTGAEMWSLEELLERIREFNLSILDLSPSYWHQMVQDWARAPGSALDSVRLVIVGGDVMPPESITEWQQSPLKSARLLNAYGPTEATITSTTFELSAGAAFERTGSRVPIGRPFPNKKAYILDADLHLVPVGVPGELFIGGPGLARGYLNHPEMTADRFVPDPYSGTVGARLYRTGDWARYQPDGNIEFLGRIDHQVKVRGFRIELGEIETRLAEHPAVRQAAVLARDVLPGDTQLVAYYVATRDPAPVPSELQSFVGERLPDYMIPSVWVRLDEFPLTPAGKIDRRALPAPDAARPELGQAYVAPRNSTEEALAELWREILGLEHVGVHDNFFDLGGHSLLALRLMARIRKRFGQDLPLATLFEGATIEQLAKILLEPARTMSRAPLVAIQPLGSRPPLFLVHPVGGHVLCYTELARLLGADQPTYGLQAAGLDGGHPPYTRLAEMAAHYIKALQNVKAAGPYFLGGWSMGGVVAFEMAQQLHRQGQPVDLLALIDSPAPGPSSSGLVWPRGDGYHNENDPVLLAELLRDVAKAQGKPLSVSPEEIAQLEPGDRIGYLLEHGRQLALFPPDTGPTEIRQLLKVFQSNLLALSSYAPQTFPGQITLFRACEGKRADSSALGWDGFSSEPVRVHSVPGDHFTMLAMPNVRLLARAVRDCLDRAAANVKNARTM